jgi:hypothetical protein
MGSLILLLLVIDRRAKIVARTKALEEVRRAEAEDEKATAGRAEWDRRRQALHEQLSRENSDVLEKISSFQNQLETSARDLQVEQGRDREALQQIQTEKSRLNRQGEELAARARAAAQSREQSEALRSELTRLTADLRKMEQALVDLKAFRQRQQHTYSLVPYRGKRGDNRRPLYLECAAGGLVFHPDRLTVPIGETSGPEIRAEVERRLARRLAAQPQATSAKEEAPYLLFLIRPDGIVTYYQALAALNGLKLDFGYEFLQADWILDFPEDGRSATKQPWMIADEKTETEPTDQRNHSRGQLFRTVHGIPPRMGLTGEQSTSDTGPELPDGPQPAGKPGSPMTQPGAMAARPTRIESARASSPALQGDSNISFRDEENHQPRSQASFGGDPAAVRMQGLGTRGRGFESAASGSSPPVADARGPAQPGSPPRAPDSPIGAPGLTLDAPGSSLHGSGTPAFSDSGNGGGPVPPRAAPPGLGAQRVQPPSLTEPRLAEGPLGSGLNFSPLQPGLTTVPPQQGSGREGNARAEGSSSNGGSSVSSPGFGGKSRGEPEGNEASVAPAGPLDSLTPSESSKKKSSSLPPVRRWVNRDWSIFIECQADGVVLYPGGLSIAMAKLAAPGKIGDQPLLTAVQQMIGRRQAITSQAAGDEPIGRPHLHFLVRPDGLRSYYQAYPQLEGLQLPMTRDNLDPDDDITRHMANR